MFNFRKKQRVFERVPDTDFVEREISRFKISSKRSGMAKGEQYYSGHHDILRHKREVIGEDGTRTEVKNLINNKIVDNQYKKMVDQKTNYLAGKPISVRSDNDEYTKKITSFLTKDFMRTLKDITQDSLNCGIGWLSVNFDTNGNICFNRQNPCEIIAGWSDSRHTKLDYLIRIYEIVSYEDKKDKIIQKVEVYESSGISYFELEQGKLTPATPFHENYFNINDAEFNWDRIPFIPFKYNSKEIPLIKMVKSLQDGLNSIESNFLNQMQEDTHNTIMVLVNYEGENLGEFRRNLATYGAVNISSDRDNPGDVRTLNVEVNATNYQIILEIFKKAIIENAMGYDAKDDRLSGNANQMNIQSMYSDIDLDANNMETEFQASFEQLIWFIDCHLYNTNQGDFEKENIDIIFNRDMLMNECEIIDNIAKSVGILSDQTVVAQHPWVDDPLEELNRIQEQTDIAPYNFGGENDG